MKLHKKVQTLDGSQHCPVRKVYEIESVCALLMDSLSMICSYIKNCRHNFLVNNSASITVTVNAPVLQSSINGPLLFNFLSNESVWFIQYSAKVSYAGVINLLKLEAT